MDTAGDTAEVPAKINEKPSDELKNTIYELFMVALSILAIVNLPLSLLFFDPDVAAISLVMDRLLSVVFLGDFLYRFFSAPAKSTYLLRQFGWADFVAGLPFPLTTIFRLFRTVRSGRLLRQRGAQKLMRDYTANRASSALMTLLFLIILVLQLGAIAILAVEIRSPESNIRDASDALWYIYVSITTVGYGDHYPVTDWGRIIGAIVLAMGVGLYGTLTAFLANVFLGVRLEAQASQAETPPANAESPQPHE